jgi:hypothetical protein
MALAVEDINQVARLHLGHCVLVSVVEYAVEYHKNKSQSHLIRTKAFFRGDLDAFPCHVE